MTAASHGGKWVINCGVRDNSKSPNDPLLVHQLVRRNLDVLERIDVIQEAL